jgi:pilus assembly protein Flp/PilA
VNCASLTFTTSSIGFNRKDSLIESRRLGLCKPEGAVDTMRRIARFLQNEEAATAVEYSVVLALILMVVIGAISAFGSQASGLWSNIFSGLQAVGF